MGKNLTQGIEKAPQRALYKALGLSDAELEKPIIAIVSAQSGIGPEHAHLSDVAEAVKMGVIASGGTPVILPSVGVSDGLAMGVGKKYALPSREIVADGVEAMLVGHAFDGVALIPGAGNVLPGMLLGALRVNVPTIVVSGGPIQSNIVNGKKSSVNAVFEGVGGVRGGKLSLSELQDLENGACGENGSGAELNTANAMSCLLETLGIALPENGTALASSADRIRLAKKSGEYIVKAVEDDVTPKMILTKDAFINAITCENAIGADANTVLHLIALANECGIELTYDTFAKISNITPTLCSLSPATEHDMDAFGKAGGVMAVLAELASKGLIKGNMRTITGKTLAEQYAESEIKDDSVIRSVDNPLSKTGALAFLKGNLAENGAVVLRSTVSPSLLKFVGKAKCFDCEEDAVSAILGGKIQSGDVVVIRYEGPQGGPGMREMLSPLSALVGMGLADSVALITDGRVGATKATAIGHVSPEAGVGGKIAIVHDGDKIKIDIPNSKLELDVPSKEVATRTKKLKLKDVSASGYLLRYAHLVTSAEKGAVMKKKF